MSNNIPGNRLRQPTNDAGEIRDLASAVPVAPMSGDELYPGEMTASLSLPSESILSPLEPLNEWLGMSLTAGNPAWFGDPVALMRLLQKVLVEHSLKLEQSERRPCLDGIEVVEKNIQLRLRYQQMRMSELEGNLVPDVVAREMVKAQ